MTSNHLLILDTATAPKSQWHPRNIPRSLMRFLRELVKRCVVRRRCQRDAEILSRLDPDQLRDIGLTYDQIGSFVISLHAR